MAASVSENTNLLPDMGSGSQIGNGGQSVPPGKFTMKLGFSIFSAVMGMFQFGYNTGVINAPQKVMEEFYNMTWQDRNDGDVISESTLTLLWGFTVSIFAIGGLFGGLIGAWWADTFGRVGGMMLNTGFGILAAVLMGFSELAGSYEMVIIGRLIVGFNCDVRKNVCLAFVK